MAGVAQTMAESAVLDPSEDMVVGHYSHSRHYMIVAMVVVGLVTMEEVGPSIHQAWGPDHRGVHHEEQSKATLILVVLLEVLWVVQLVTLMKALVASAVGGVDYKVLSWT